VNFDLEKYNKTIILDSLSKNFIKNEYDIKKNIEDGMNQTIRVKYEKRNINSSQYDLEINNLKEEIWLLPMYILKQYYKDKVYTLLINGQTGELIGTIVDKKVVKRN
jgi:hypothetical protein